MYQNIFIEYIDTDTIVHLWDDIDGYRKFKYQKYGYKKNINGNYKTIFGDKVKKVSWWTKNDLDQGLIFESDVNISTRVLVDLYYENETPSEKHNIVFFDIEVESSKGLPNVTVADNEITAISLYNKSSDEYIVYILDKDNIITNSINNNEEIIPFSNEKELLLSFLIKFREINPTILTGWNIDFFDIPYLYNRLKNVFGDRYADALSPINIVKYNPKTNKYIIAGISSLDYIELYKNFVFKEQSSYTLDNICKIELNKGKVVYDGSLNDLIKNDINKFIEYSLTDTKLVSELDLKLNFIELTIGICNKSHVSLEDIYFSSRWIEGAILSYMKKLNLIVPNRKQYDEQDEHNFTGAYVKDPIVGLYNWIYDLDMTSMYPNIVITLNISPETKIGKIMNWNPIDYMSNNNNSYDIIISDKMINGISKLKIKEILDVNGYAVSLNGIIYKQDEKGIIPLIIDEWYKEKDNYDALMKQYGNKGDKEKSKYYKQRRTISKTMLNSIYGVLALPSFRFFDIDNASAVTNTGVELIKYVERTSNWYYNKKLNTVNKDYCLYCDTDSAFLPALPLINQKWNTESELIDLIINTVKNIQDFLNDSFSIFSKNYLNVDKHRFHIKQEIIAKSGLWTSKKRYALWIINESGISKNYIDYKGLDVIRSSFPVSFKALLTEVLTDILNGVSENILTNKIVDFHKNIKNLSMLDVGVPTSVKNITKFGTNDTLISKNFGNWIKGTPVHVKSAICYNELISYYNLQNKYPMILNGEKIKWVYLKQNSFGMESLALRGYNDPVEILNFMEKYIDKNKMFDKILSGKLEDFYSAMKWNFPNFTINNKFF